MKDPLLIVVLLLIGSIIFHFIFEYIWVPTRTKKNALRKASKEKEKV